MLNFFFWSSQGRLGQRTGTPYQALGTAVQPRLFADLNTSTTVSIAHLSR
jgi:hypothetical protein